MAQGGQTAERLDEGHDEGHQGYGHDTDETRILEHFDIYSLYSRAGNDATPLTVCGKGVGTRFAVMPMEGRKSGLGCQVDFIILWILSSEF